MSRTYTITESTVRFITKISINYFELNRSYKYFKKFCKLKIFFVDLVSLSFIHNIIITVHKKLTLYFDTMI